MDNATDTHRIDGAELATVRIMGIVSEVDEHATNCNYTINDGTGTIKCKSWIEKDTGARHQRVGECSFVKIDGNLRDYEGSKHLLVYSIRKIEDWNEMTHHFLGELPFCCFCFCFCLDFYFFLHSSLSLPSSFLFFSQM